MKQVLENFKTGDCIVEDVPPPIVRMLGSGARSSAGTSVTIRRSAPMKMYKDRDWLTTGSRSGLSGMACLPRADPNVA